MLRPCRAESNKNISRKANIRPRSAIEQPNPNLETKTTVAFMGSPVRFAAVSQTPCLIIGGSRHPDCWLGGCRTRRFLLGAPPPRPPG